MLKSLHISSVVVLAILFKLCFFNFILVANNCEAEKIPTLTIFKPGKHRRRTTELLSVNHVLSVEEDGLAGEKEENEKKTRSSVIFIQALFTLFMRPLRGLMEDKPFAPHFLFPHLFKDHLSVSVLRI